MTGFLAGLLLGFSLIAAIGAQNAFILKQGLRREHVFVLCLICSVSDALLIGFGVFGFSLVAAGLPALVPVARYAGAAFLFCYGAKSFATALGKDEVLVADASQRTELRSALASCLAFTWLNPHVYLDTLVLLGSVSTQYPQQQAFFALGAASASFCFFFALGYGARLLAPLFKRPLSWKVLEVVIGCVMWSIAAGLVWRR
ncbi:amino acid transporter [Geomonas silvestris]|uniref:Amino acid transporter n=1 Tax=Geomonas silvestris TaxID=2740184 RepID=A0A6V8MFE4_9BACT|nr:LysE/ArgO family amino acid transporter [Geomonas silvestris]GFO58662.1 amino acid transporter [Geomonas silvestris]